MADRGTGAIVNVGSINGLVGMAHSALYSATKAAIHSLTKSWAAEYGPSGVRVSNCEVAWARNTPGERWLAGGSQSRLTVASRIPAASRSGTGRWSK